MEGVVASRSNFVCTLTLCPLRCTESLVRLALIFVEKSAKAISLRLRGVGLRHFA